MPRCEICGQDKQRGYRINPRTGRAEPGRFWCREDYERIVARAARMSFDNNVDGGAKRRGRDAAGDFERG